MDGTDFMKLATTAAGEAGRYGVYTVKNWLTEGTIGLEAIKRGFDEAGGLTVNLGGLLGLASEKLEGLNLFEVNVTSGGVTGRIGTGGIDAGTIAAGLLDGIRIGVTEFEQIMANKTVSSDGAKEIMVNNAGSMSPWELEEYKAMISEKVDEASKNLKTEQAIRKTRIGAGEPESGETEADGGKKALCLLPSTTLLVYRCWYTAFGTSSIDLDQLSRFLTASVV